MSDPHNLQRFVDAQRGIYAQALSELEDGRKRSHWMWFIFPQLVGLGFSSMAQRYAIASIEEAQAYLLHPELGPRLRASTDAVNRHRGRSARAIFGSPDDMKFRSSMTLFAEAAPDEGRFADAIGTFYAGERDPLTVTKLRAH